MAYTVPRATISQEFTQLPVFSNQPLPAFIIGPQYSLFRYTNTLEKADTAIGAYVNGTDTDYAYPNLPDGGVADPSYVRVFFESAKAKYFPLTSLGTVTHGDYVTVTSASNKVAFDNVVLATGNAVDRTSVFSNRDVAVGDTIQLTGATSGAITTKIKTLAASNSALVVGTGAADASNYATAMESDASATVNFVSGTANSDIAFVSSTSADAYIGHASKAIMADTLSFIVTTAGNPTNARFTVTSTNGAFAPVTGVAMSSPSGTTGTLTLDNFEGNLAKVAVTLSNSALFVVGQKWSVAMVAQVDATVVPVGGSTYTSVQDITYKLTVVRGGPFYDGTNAATCARVGVTSNSVDSSGQVNVAVNTFFTVGSYGFQAKFTGGSGVDSGSLILGDVYYIALTAAKPASINIVYTTDTLPTFVGQVTAQLFLTKTSVEIPQYEDVSTNDKNWTATADTITIFGDTAIFDSTLVQGGVPVELAVISANQFVHYRALETVNSTAIQSVSTVTAATDIVGLIDVDNPMGQGLFEAITNAAGVPVYFLTVASDDLAGYQAALDLARINNQVYSFVPLTFDSTIQAAVVAHVNTMSTPENARWRVAWLSAPLVAARATYTTLDGSADIVASVVNNPDTTITDYTKVVAVGATFITHGVRATDQVLINFHQDSNGNTLYDTYTIATVVSETTLILSKGLPAAILAGHEVKIEIQRVYTKDEQIIRVIIFSSMRMLH